MQRSHVFIHMTSDLLEWRLHGWAGRHCNMHFTCFTSYSFISGEGEKNSSKGRCESNNLEESSMVWWDQNLVLWTNTTLCLLWSVRNVLCEAWKCCMDSPVPLWPRRACEGRASNENIQQKYKDIWEEIPADCKINARLIFQQDNHPKHKSSPCNVTSYRLIAVSSAKATSTKYLLKGGECLCNQLFCVFFRICDWFVEICLRFGSRVFYWLVPKSPEDEEKVLILLINTCIRTGCVT